MGSGSGRDADPECGSGVDTDAEFGVGSVSGRSNLRCRVGKSRESVGKGEGEEDEETSSEGRDSEGRGPGGIERERGRTRSRGEAGREGDAAGHEWLGKAEAKGTGSRQTERGGRRKLDWRSDGGIGKHFVCRSIQGRCWEKIVERACGRHKAEATDSKDTQKHVGYRTVAVIGGGFRVGSKTLGFQWGGD